MAATANPRWDILAAMDELTPALEAAAGARRAAVDRTRDMFIVFLMMIMMMMTNAWFK